MNGNTELKSILRAALFLAVTGSGEVFSRTEVERLVDKHHQYLLALLRFKTGSSETAMELLQETYLSFLNTAARTGSRKRFKDETAIRNYLITIALNKVKNHYKRSSRERLNNHVFSSTEEMDDCFSIISSGEASAEERLIADERERKLKACTALAMEKIQERYRLVLEYKFTHGLDNPQIAGTMGIGIKAAESLLFRAKAAFKKEFRKIALKENGFFDDEVDL